MTRKCCEIHTKKIKQGWSYMSIIVNTMTHNGAKIISEFKFQKIFCKALRHDKIHIIYHFLMRSKAS